MHVRVGFGLSQRGWIFVVCTHFHRSPVYTVVSSSTSTACNYDTWFLCSTSLPTTSERQLSLGRVRAVLNGTDKEA